MSNSTCSVEGCSTDDRRAPLRKGLCGKHYMRLRKYGSTDDRSTSHKRSRTKTQSTCSHCGHSFVAGNSQALYCSKFCSTWARYLGPGLSLHCGSCSKPMMAGPESRKSSARCEDCAPEHGANGYSKGCRCETCRSSKAANQREWGRLQYETKGVWPRGDWIRDDSRTEIYERDDWTCQICLIPVDLNAHYLSHWAPTLDHIQPRSFDLVPNHAPENLRTAHRWCNSYRGDRVHVADDEVARAAAEKREGDLLVS